MLLIVNIEKKAISNPTKTLYKRNHEFFFFFEKRNHEFIIKIEKKTLQIVRKKKLTIKLKKNQNLTGSSEMIQSSPFKTPLLTNSRAA